jgi:hypothetical protein
MPMMFLVWILCLTLLLLHVALCDAVSSSCFFFLIFLQKSDVPVHCRIREFFCRAILFGELVSRSLFGSAETRDTIPTRFSVVETLNIRSDKHITEFRIKSSMPHSRRWTPRFKTSSTRRHGGSTLVSSSLPRRCVGICHGRFVFPDHHGLHRI